MAEKSPLTPDQQTTNPSIRIDRFGMAVVVLAEKEREWLLLEIRKIVREELTAQEKREQ